MNVFRPSADRSDDRLDACNSSEILLGGELAAPGAASDFQSSAASSALVTRVAPYSRIRRWHPADAALMTGPGTAPSGLPISVACPAVFREPERHPASMTAVALDPAAIRRLRMRKRHFVGAEPQGSSDTTAPVSTILVSSASWPLG